MIETLGRSTFIMKPIEDRLEGVSLRFSASTCVAVVFPIFRPEFWADWREHTGSANPKVRWSARRALRSRGDTGRLERRLVSRRAREAEKRDGEVRFSVRPCLPELGMGQSISVFLP